MSRRPPFLMTIDRRRGRHIQVGGAVQMRSQRLTYRQLDARDAGRIAALAGEWDVARMTSRIPHPYSLIDADHVDRFHRP